MSDARRRLGGALARLGERLRPDTLANKVALLLSAITVVAFGASFLYVVPQLRESLARQSLADLERASENTSDRLADLMDTDVKRRTLDDRVRGVADESGARVTLLGVQRSGVAPGALYVITDSRVGGEVNLSYAVADRAVATGRVETGIGRDETEAVAQAAVPLSQESAPTEWVALYSRSLEEVAGAVDLVRRQVLLAGLIALVISLVGGYVVARALARRVKRLEVAARAVAARRQVDPLPIDSEDELGQLTRTFNEMQEQLARVDRARRDFIANASHELRTPIFSLAGFAELLEDDDLDAGTRSQFLRQMREQTERLQKLAVELLDLSRLDAGSLEINPERVDLVELARSVAGEFQPALVQHSSRLETRLPEAGVVAWCDPARVAQIVRILLDNALRHTPEGARVTISAGHSNGSAELAVADSAGALADDAQDRVFERFYTADAASGSGLGLAIAKELAERMSGRILLDAGAGATIFTLALPLGPPSADRR
jgi:signal transduction histidine kinase